VLRAPHVANSIMSQIAMVACRVGVAIVPNSFTEFEKSRVIYRNISPMSDVVTAAAVWNEKRASDEIREFIALADP
jgi:DNA-binding transcriptional LysR family regulator